MEDQALHHVLDFQIMNLELTGFYSIFDGFGVEASLPLRLTSISAEFLDADRESLASFSSIHHRDEVVAGPGDAEVAGRYRLLAPSSNLSLSIDLRVGVSLPTGKIEPDPFKLGEEGKTHQHMFFGSGTFNPVVGFEAFYTTNDFAIVSWGRGLVNLAENKYGYRGRSKYLAGLGIIHNLGLEDFGLSAKVIGRLETPAKWDGRDARNSGITQLLASLGGFWRISSNVTLNIDAKKAVYHVAKGGQLEMPGVVGLGIQYTGSIGPAHVEHPSHDHGSLEIKAGPSIDVSEAAKGGASFKLGDVLVPNKITVLDFWAEWCHPCEHITQALSELSAKYQNLAVRKIEVPSFDTPVAMEHLKGMSALPIVRVYDGQGVLLRELVGTTEAEVRKEIESLFVKTNASVP